MVADLLAFPLAPGAIRQVDSAQRRRRLLSRLLSIQALDELTRDPHLFAPCLEILDGILLPPDGALDLSGLDPLVGHPLRIAECPHNWQGLGAKRNDYPVGILETRCPIVVELLPLAGAEAEHVGQVFQDKRAVVISQENSQRVVRRTLREEPV